MPQFDPVLHYFLKNDVELIIKDHPKKKDIPKKEEKLRNGGNTKNSDDPIKMTQKCGIPQIEDKKTNKTPKNWRQLKNKHLPLLPHNLWLFPLTTTARMNFDW